MHSFYRYGPPDPYTHLIFDRLHNDNRPFPFRGKKNRWNAADRLIIKKEKPVLKRTLPKYIGAVCETAGQFAYIYAIGDSEHVMLAAPIISAYCAASVVWSRIFLKERMSWKHYLAIAVTVIGIVIMGIFDI